MPHVETTIEIERPPDEVFAYLSDLRNAMEWSVGLLDVEYDGELAEGTCGVDTRRLGRRTLRMPWTVTGFDAPTRLVVEYRAPFPMAAAFTLRQVPAGTELTCATELRPRGLWRLLGPLMALEARKTDAAQFRKAKTILEAGAGGSAAPA